MAENVFVVPTDPIDGQDESFIKGYDTTHLPEVLDGPGDVAAQRYDLSEIAVPDDQEVPATLAPSSHRYMVIHELDQGPDQVMQDLRAGASSRKRSLGETLDVSGIAMTGRPPRSERRLARS